MQRVRSFENELLNIFYGLAKGYKMLGDFATKFSNDLGFRVIGIEPAYIIHKTNEKVTPDLVLASNKLRESLIIEWTKAQILREDKLNQIKKYLRLSPQDMTMYVSAQSCTNIDVVVVIPTRNEENFKQKLRKEEVSILLISYNFDNHDSKKVLKKTFGKFKVQETESFFQSEIVIERIPYVFPDIDLSNLSKSQIVDYFCNAILTILKNKREGETFTIEDLTRTALKTVFFDFLGLHKRRQIMKVFRQLMHLLIEKQQWLNGVIKRIPKDQATWQIIWTVAERENKLKQVARKLDIFRKRINGSYPRVIPGLEDFT